MITLTINEILDLAEFAGLSIKKESMPDKDDLNSEISIINCPKDGVLDEDTGRKDYYKYVAYFSEYPEEGCMPLGESICPKCNKAWGDHDFGVPMPYCP